MEKALYPDSILPGVIEKIAAMASREHGDARKAVALLAKSAYLSEKAGTKIMLPTVDDAASEIDIDRYVTLLQCSPIQLQATMVAIIDLVRENDNKPVSTGAAYEHYREFCRMAGIRPLTIRAFGDMIAELDIYSLIQSRIISKGRYGRSREIILELPPDVIGKMHQAVLTNFDLGNAQTPQTTLTASKTYLYKTINYK